MPRPSFNIDPISFVPPFPMSHLHVQDLLGWDGILCTYFSKALYISSVTLLLIMSYPPTRCEGGIAHSSLHFRVVLVREYMLEPSS